MDGSSSNDGCTIVSPPTATPTDNSTMPPSSDNVLSSSSSLDSSSVPRIVAYAYKEFVHQKPSGLRTAVCMTCDKKVSEKGSTTSNFIRHVKAFHPER